MFRRRVFTHHHVGDSRLDPCIFTLLLQFALTFTHEDRWTNPNTNTTSTRLTHSVRLFCPAWDNYC
ncbi:MAG: hypothetical protein LBI18_05125, partial [Planctomycetaceae bacterium]|nr:hypothetical protein [Planctomycetaceae bacterium]